jgi:hypothetical protein
LRAVLGSDAKSWTIDVATPETLGATLCGMPGMPRAVALVSHG